LAANEQHRLEEVLIEIDGRTLISLKNFFLDLDKNSATLRIVENNTEYIFDEVAVHRGRERTENTIIEEDIKIMSGTLLGFLPEHRKFELKLANNEVIYGTATKEASEFYQNSLNQELVINNCKVEVIVRTMKPLNREEKELYRLTNFLETSENA